MPDKVERNPYFSVGLTKAGGHTSVNDEQAYYVVVKGITK